MSLERLLKYGFFPKELPQPFTTIAFGEFGISGTFPRVNQSYSSRPCLHNLARPGNQRRALSIPNPFNYFITSKLLDVNGAIIESTFAKSKISQSKPKTDPTNFRAYIPSLDGKDLPEQRAKIRAGSKYILRADISRFYNSIYTHSIPWAIMGKLWAKEHRNGGFANDLDKFLRNAQDKQTLGIPVGPDTSLIVSELIACCIDEEIQRHRWKGFRYVDDYEFNFLTRSDAEKALPFLESILQEFELALNPTKSFVDDLPILFEQPWRLKSKNFRFSKSISNNELLEYFDLLFEHFLRNRNEPVLRYGIARLRSCHFSDPNFLMDLLFQCILVEPGTLKESLFLLQELNVDIKKSKLSPILNNLIDYSGKLSHCSGVK